MLSLLDRAYFHVSAGVSFWGGILKKRQECVFLFLSAFIGRARRCLISKLYILFQSKLRALRCFWCVLCAKVSVGIWRLHFYPKLIEEALGTKFNMVVGYGGGGDMDLAIEKGEIHCRAGTVSAFLVREPTRTWAKTGFVRPLVQSGLRRETKLPDVPTIYELMEAHKTPEAIRRVAKVMLASGDLGRPVAGSPGLPAELLKILRDAFNKMVGDAEFLADAKKRGLEVIPLRGEELERIGKELIVQPADVIERVKKLLEQ